MKLLHIDSSVQEDNSVSRQLTRSVVDQWQRAYPDVEVIYRDLALKAPSHLSAEILGAGYIEPEQRSPLQRHEAAFGEELLREFLAVDVIVIGAPMYNFSIPSQLKAWLDRVVVKGRSFTYTASGPVGLAGGKKAVIVSSRGGMYAPGSPAQSMDHQESYLKVVLGFMGISDVTVIRAEGMNIEEKREQQLAGAHNQVRLLLKEAA